MINVNELRRDNILYQKSRGIEIGIDNPNGLHLIKAWGVDYPIEDFEPVLITPEWLEKFSFVKDEHSLNRYTKGAYAIIMGRGGASNAFCLINSGILSTYCKYLHQLQNLYFALTSEELTIKKETV